MTEDRTKFIKDCLITIVSDDYESWEIILQQIEPLLAFKGIKIDESEIAAALRSVIAEGYVDAYRLAGKEPYSVKAEYAPELLRALWYYATRLGKENAKGIPTLSGENPTSGS